MLAVIRILLLGVFIVVAGILGCLLCLVRPFHRNNTHIVANVFGSMHRLLGTEIEIRVPASVQAGGPFVYVANHQNSWDIFTMSFSLRRGTVSIGKKSLKWIPFFGQVYWLSGNILIDRKNSSRAHGTIGMAVKAIKEKELSIWMFPEGTRSYGRGLLPFKTGAFHTAMQANVPVVPVCMSTTHKKIKLNRWNNGKIIIEMLPPIDTNAYSRDSIRSLIADTYQLMHDKIAALDEEINSESTAKKQ